LTNSGSACPELGVRRESFLDSALPYRARRHRGKFPLSALGKSCAPRWQFRLSPKLKSSKLNTFEGLLIRAGEVA
jgi:hypothetical protein